MPFTYPDRGAIKFELLARLEAGEMLKDICAAPHMPTENAMRLWAKAPGDDWFGPAVKTAIARGTWMRRYAFRQAAADELVARRCAGETLRAILRDAHMPTYGGYTFWRRTQVPFAARLSELEAAQRVQRGWNLKGGRRPYDPAVAERLLDAVFTGRRLTDLHRTDPTLPGTRVVDRWRAENRVFDARLRDAVRIGRKVRGGKARNPFADPDLADAVLDAVSEGATLNQVARMPGMPSATTLYSWKQDGEFARQLRVTYLHAAEFVMEEGEQYAGVRGQSRPKHAALRRARALRARAWS